VNRVTGGLFCPAGYTPGGASGTSGMDYAIDYCYR
jgi:hypothetical protein